MKADLERRNIFFKTKNTNKQPTNSSSACGGNERHNMMEGGRKYSEEVEVIDLVRKTPTTTRKKKTHTHTQ
jgi:hypothetical protein